jgi:hypothetical protein
LNSQGFAPGEGWSTGRPVSIFTLFMDGALLVQPDTRLTNNSVVMIAAERMESMVAASFQEKRGKAGRYSRPEGS